MMYKCFYPILWVIFSFSLCLLRTRVFNLRMFILSIFSLVPYAFGVVSNKALPNSRLWRFTSMFSSKNSFRSVIHFAARLQWAKYKIKNARLLLKKLLESQDGNSWAFTRVQSLSEDGALCTGFTTHPPWSWPWIEFF